MAYDVKKVTKLGHLRQLMDKSRQELASKTSLEELAEQVDGIIAEGGEPNVITGVKVNGTALEVTDKAVDVPVPVRVSQLDNDSGFQTQAQVQAAVAAVDLSGKQDKLTGTQGQVVGFDAQGQAVAQDAPEGGGLTQAQADGRYFRIGESGHGTQELRLENHTGATSWKVLFQRASDNSILISPTKEEATTNRVILAGISEPEFDDDAANKKYVDNAVGGVQATAGQRVPYVEITDSTDLQVPEIKTLKYGQMLMLHFYRGTDWFYPLEFSINGKDQCQVYQFDSTGKSLEEFSAATTEATTLLLIFWDRKWILLREWRGSLEY